MVDAVFAKTILANFFPMFSVWCAGLVDEKGSYTLDMRRQFTFSLTASLLSRKQLLYLFSL
jgi:hypothetical protein